jgi:hypothetical protein
MINPKHTPESQNVRALHDAETTDADSDLALVVDAWPTLPATARRMILAAIEAAAAAE